MSMFCKKGIYFVLWNMACSFWLQNTVEVSILWTPNYEIISASIDKNVGAKYDSNMVHCNITKLIWVRHWGSDESQAISHNLANWHYCDTLFMLSDSNTKAGFRTKASSFPVFTIIPLLPLLLANDNCAILLDHAFHLVCRVNAGFNVCKLFVIPLFCTTQSFF